jgi:hypothetical protein
MQRRITGAPAKPIDVTATGGKRGENQIADGPYSCVYCKKKTTIDLPDGILVRAKVFAAEQRTTSRDLVVRGLKAVTETPGLDDEKRRKAAIRYLPGRMQASNTEPMVPMKREDIYDR